MAESLSEFFGLQPQANLDDCDREPIHLSCAVQDVGGLIAVQGDPLRIVAASAGAQRTLRPDGPELIGAQLDEVNSELCQAVNELDRDPDTRRTHQTVEAEFERDGVSLECLAHWSNDLWILEFLPCGDLDMRSLRTHLRRASQDGARIANAASLPEAADLTCRAIRDLTGFQRVDVYRFHADWSGEVIGESKADHMQGVQGLHFPATDIPKQARELYSIVPFRCIAKTDDHVDAILQHKTLLPEPIDLSRSLVRSVSQMHTAYLRNMGVQSSFSLAILHKGKLWGLVACHSDEPGMPPFDVWALARDLADSFAAYLKHEDLRLSARKIVELRDIERLLSEALSGQADLGNALSLVAPSLLSLLNADGFAFKHGEDMQVAGNAPPKEFIEELVAWLPDKTGEDLHYSTTALHEDWPRAKEHMDSACGVLVQPVRPNRSYYMIWFRAPHAETVYWAGKPETKASATDPGTLAGLRPRESFQAWRASHNTVSKEWTEVEQQAASDSLREVLAIAVEMLILGEENDMLRTFASAAAHDLKAPLRGINYALSVMEEENFDPSAVKEIHDIAQISTTRLSDLTASMMQLTALTAESIRKQPVDLENAIRETVSLLVVDIRSSGAEVQVDPIPPVAGDPALLMSLFLNLVANSVKFRREGHPPLISVSGKVVQDSMVEIRLADNGIGIPTEYQDRVFLPLVRLHSKSEIEGTGLGLAICRRIVDLHGGTIEAVPNVDVGTAFVIRLPGSTA